MTKYKIDEKFFGNFVEHMGRALYGGIYDVTNDKFNSEVTSKLKEINTSIIRYPGGNFVSGYDWMDGIGPRESRPTRLDLAWDSIEPNIVGTDEFLSWAESNGFEAMLCVNLGSGTELHAARLVEYCNSDALTTITNLRRENGRENCYGIKYWCLGNEMDGPWQIMHCSAEDYSKKAREAAKLMKLVDPDIKLIACGSSQCELPTYPQWDRVVLEELYPYVDYLSAHRYYDHNITKDFKEFLYSYIDLENYIDTLRGILKYCKSLHRSSKDVYISFDEWNVVNSSTWEKRSREFAPHESETKNTFLDSLVFGDMIISMLKNADIIKIACQSMLVNVGAPIMVNEDGTIFYQTIYYPLFDVFSRKPKNVVKVELNSNKEYIEKYGEVNVLNYVLTESDGCYVMYVVNHSNEEQDIESVTIMGKKLEISKIESYTHENLYATNTKDKIEVVNGARKINSKNKIPSFSWNIVEFKEK